MCMAVFMNVLCIHMCVVFMYAPSMCSVVFMLPAFMHVLHVYLCSHLCWVLLSMCANVYYVHMFACVPMPHAICVVCSHVCSCVCIAVCMCATGM